jgi:hypothetical protein
MTFDEAVRELKSPGESGVEGYIRRATAAATYYANYMTRSDHPAPSTRRKTVMQMSDAEFDQALERRFGKKGGTTMQTRDALKPEYSAHWTPMGKRPGGKVGGRKIMVLTGQLTGYYIDKDENGDTALFYYPSADDPLDPGTTHDRAPLTKAARTRGKVEQLETRSLAQRTREFWARHANG